MFIDVRRAQLVKQDSVISFGDQRRNYLLKQESVLQFPPVNRSSEGHPQHHVSILTKRRIEFLD